MKRKILHNAINNQEDEDSSVCPIFFHSEGASGKMKEDSVENNTTQFFGETVKYKDDPTIQALPNYGIQV